MGASAEFIAYVQELLVPLGKLDAGRFFGGYAIKYGNRQFAMIMSNTLYLRVNDATRGQYEAQGSEPFSYATKKGVVLVRKFYAAPEHLFDDQDQLLAWARQAIVAAG